MVPALPGRDELLHTRGSISEGASEMAEEFTGQVAVVTGGGRGIG